MFKVTPNPPSQPRSHHYLSPKDNLVAQPGSETSKAINQSREDLLASIHSIMDSAAATTYENTENLTGPHRKVAMGVVRLIELAQRKLPNRIEAPYVNW